MQHVIQPHFVGVFATLKDKEEFEFTSKIKKEAGSSMFGTLGAFRRSWASVRPGGGAAQALVGVGERRWESLEHPVSLSP